VFELERRLEAEVPAGGRMAFTGPVENPLVPGSYTIDVYIAEDVGAVNVTVQGLRLLHFNVDGATESQGVVVVKADVEPVLEEGAG
jgi:hypothetical protein